MYKVKSNISLHEHCTRIVHFIVCLNNGTILWRWLEYITYSRLYVVIIHTVFQHEFIFTINHHSLAHIFICCFNSVIQLKLWESMHCLEDKLILIFLRCYLFLSSFFMLCYSLYCLNLVAWKLDVSLNIPRYFLILIFYDLFNWKFAFKIVLCAIYIAAELLCSFILTNNKKNVNTICASAILN